MKAGHGPLLKPDEWTLAPVLARVLFEVTRA